MLKRITAILLVLAMAVSSFPLTAAASEDSGALVNTEETSLHATSTLGNLLAEEINQEQEAAAEADSQYGAGYALYELVVTGSRATVTFDTMEEANLLVCIYDEDTMRMITSANTVVTAEQTTALLDFPEELPPAFYAEVFLLDNYDFSPLCASLECPLYTTDMQELLNSTVDSYDPEQVLNLDGDKQTNFMVCTDGTKLVEAEVGVNLVAMADEENLVYVIENADETFTSLVAGDTVVYPYNDKGDILVIRVSQIAVEGTTVTITGQDVELTDVFSHIKISESADMGDVKVSQEDMNEGIEYLGAVTPEGPAPLASGGDSGNLQLAFKLSLEHEDECNVRVSVDGELKMSMDIGFQYYLTLERQYVEFTNTVTNSVTISVTGEIYTDDNYLFKDPVRVELGVPGLAIQFHPKVVLSFSGAISAEFNMTIPMVATFRNGSLKFSIGRVGSNLGQMQAEVTFFFGIDVEPSIVIGTEKIFKLELSFPAGLQIQISTSKSAVDVAYPPERHTCELCFAIDISLVREVSIILKCFNSDALSAELKLWEHQIPLLEGYLSFDHEEFEIDIPPCQCPHREYRVNIYAINSKNEKETNAVYYCDTVELEDVFNGYAIEYVPAGSYLFSVYLPTDDATVHCSVSVADTKTVVLTTSQEYLDMLEAAKKFRIDPEELKETDHRDWGTIGDSIKWVLYKSGKLVFSGEGSIPGYSTSNRPQWYQERDKITSIEIGKGITSIGEYAFADLNKVKTIILPDSLQSISRATFQNCTSLKEVRMPANLNWSGWSSDYGGMYYSAWSGTTNVERIHYTTGKDGSMRGRGTSDPSGSFSNVVEDYYYCRTLEYISKDSLKTVYIEDGITSIAGYAFYKTTALADIYIPVSVTSIGSYAFYDSNISEVFLPMGLTSLGSYAFYSCNKLTEILLPEMLTEIPAYCFAGCSGLTELVIPNGVTTLKESSFSNCTGLRAVTMPVDLNWSSWVGAYSGQYYSAWSGCTNVEQIHYTPGRSGSMRGRNSDNGYKDSDDPDYYYGRTLEYISKDSLRQVTFDEGITSIGSYAFYEATVLEDIQIPESVTYIGSYAFYNSEISEISLPTGLTSLGSFAFCSCNNLTEILLPETLTEIPESCFSGCTGLTELVIPNGVTKLNRNSFSNCTGLRSVTMPVDLNWSSWVGAYSGEYYSAWSGTVNVEQIRYTPGRSGSMRGRNSDNGYKDSDDPDYYYGRTLEYISKDSLKQVTFDEGITSIGSYAFYDSGLSSVNIPNSLKSIGNYAFAGCEGLSQIDLHLGINFIGESAFAGCTGLTELVIPETMTTINLNCFSGCTGLTELVIPDTITKLYSGAFANCTGLRSVTMPVDLNWSSWIGAYSGQYYSAWSNTSNVEIIHYTHGQTGSMRGRNSDNGYKDSDDPDYYYGRTLEYISKDSLKQVSFDAGITYIAYYAFCQSTLSEVWFHGSKPSIDSSAFYGVAATAYYPADDATWAGTAEHYGGNLTWQGYTLDAGGTPVPCGEPVEVRISEAELAAMPVPEPVVVAAAPMPELPAEPVMEQPQLTGLPEEENPDMPEETLPDGPEISVESYMIPTEPIVPAVDEESSAGTGEDIPNGPANIAPQGVFGGDHTSDLGEEYSLHTATFTGLVPGEQYVLLVMVSLEAENPLASENLLYADQKVAAEDGTLTFQYVQRYETETAYVAACGATNQNLRDAEIMFPRAYAGEDPQIIQPVVLYNGEMLVENVDYVLTGASVYTGAGEYTCGIRGINQYTGYVEKTYTVLEYVYVEGIELSDSSITLMPGDSYLLSATVIPEDAQNPAITWSSSDENVAIVDEFGAVTALADGFAVITASAVDGSGVTAECIVMVGSGLMIIRQPVSYVGRIGDTAEFVVEANSADVTYQWYFSEDDGVTWKKASCTDAVYCVEFLACRLDYQYRCEITNADGETVISDVVSFVAEEIPIEITTQPVDYTGAVNDSVNFTLEAVGNGLRYEWFYSEDGGQTWTKSHSPGYETSTLSPVLRAHRDGNQYKCLVSDVFGNCVESSVVSMTVRSSAILIISQPASVENGVLGQLYQFTVEASGENLTYRWEYSEDGGETWQLSWNQGYLSATLNVRLYDYRSGYLYRCTVTSGLKTVVTTEPASIMLQVPSVEITGQPEAQYLMSGNTAVFHVDATGTDLTYTWYRSVDKGETWVQTYLSGYNTDTLSFVANVNRASLYMCKVTDGSGMIRWSDPVKLRVLSGELKILTQPVSLQCANGETASFTVEAEGDTLKYQWYYSADGGNTWTVTFLTGYNTPTLSFGVNASRAGKVYKCVITDAAGNTLETDTVSVTIN